MRAKAHRGQPVTKGRDQADMSPSLGARQARLSYWEVDLLFCGVLNRSEAKHASQDLKKVTFVSIGCILFDKLKIIKFCGPGLCCQLCQVSLPLSAMVQAPPPTPPPFL